MIFHILIFFNTVVNFLTLISELYKFPNGPFPTQINDEIINDKEVDRAKKVNLINIMFYLFMINCIYFWLCK